MGNFSDKINEGDIPLSRCDVVMSTDLAATDTGMSAKTCRSSIAVWAMDGDGNAYRLWAKVGYLGIYQSVGFIFEGCELFRNRIRAVFIEKNGFQKIVKPVLDRGMELREKYVPVAPVLAEGDKKARIRVALGMRLARGKIWMVQGADKEFREELRVFPMSENRLDVLDESEKALTDLVGPMNGNELEAMKEKEMEREAAEVGLTAMGY